MSSRTNAAALTIGLALFVYPSFAQTGVITRSNSEIFLHLPPVGLAVSETAQVNVTNTAPPPANGGAAPLCGVTVVFYGGRDGQTILGNLAVFQLRNGDVASAPLPYALTGASGARTVIRVAITVSPILVTTDSGPQTAPCTLLSSLETFDSATGVTHAFTSASATLKPAGANASAR
jgi:hypothetical protein